VGGLERREADHRGRDDELGGADDLGGTGEHPGLSARPILIVYTSRFVRVILCRGHANLLCIVPILTDDPRREPILMLRVLTLPASNVEKKLQTKKHLSLVTLRCSLWLNLPESKYPNPAMLA